jgi:LicD family
LLLNVVFASLSMTGFNFPVLIVSSVFLLFLFLILGASSFAWNTQTSLRWEYLARNSDRFILGLLPVVIIIGYWLSDIKLITLFSTAMLIELRWLLHLHKANRLRLQQPLSEHSLAVLHTQTGDNLQAYSKKHRLNELVKHDNEIQWMGCTKHSPPCPINYYVNKLGLNTPPCCYEHMKELCFSVDELLTEMAIPHWLDGGTLLGAVRENGHFLAWEDDVDLSFMLDDSISWDSFVAEVTHKLTQQDYTVRSQKDHRMINVYYTPPMRWLFGLEQYRYRGEIKVDLIGNRVVESYGQKVMERPLFKGAMPQVESGGYGVPVEMMMPTNKIELLGKMVSCPNDSHAYLQTLYGNYTEVEYTYIDDKVANSRKNIDEASDR